MFSENKQFFEAGEINDQCNGTSLVCREILGRKLCLCKEGFEADIEHLECFKGTLFMQEKTNHFKNNFQSTVSNYLMCMYVEC